MKLISCQVTNFRSIEDSSEFNVGELTCLVGKNESGKTAILQALEAQRPLERGAASYDVVKEYPRRYVTKYDERHPDGKAPVCKTLWELNENELEILSEEFGKESIISNNISITSGYNYNGTTLTMCIDEEKAIEHILSKFKLNAAEKSSLASAKTSEQLFQKLISIEGKTEKHNTILEKLSSYRKNSIILHGIDLISEKVPKFVYVSHYDRMSGQISVEELVKNKENISVEDQIFLDFLSLAGTSLDDLKNSTRFEDLNAKCEAASNDITEQIFEYWSQNDALEVEVNISQGKPKDPPPFNEGNVVRARVKNTNHKASVPFSERSAGFVWFFSFLVKFAEIKKHTGDIIILLDEPGLTLHGKAQADLLRYIENELLPKHQVIFSTHSPFLVPAHRLNDVRIVEDVLIREGNKRPQIIGTKVKEDTLLTEKDTLFPLQGAMGYDLCQSLFVGKNTLLVEGPSDILYLQILSAALKRRDREGLSPKWTICPAGGIDKMQPFISLFSGNHLNIAVLTDRGNGDKSKVEKLKKSNILKSGSVYSITDFITSDEGDVEDIFGPVLYADIVNKAYSLNDEQKITAKAMLESGGNTERAVKQVEALFRLLPADIPEFDHYMPAEWLLNNSSIFDSNTEEITNSLSIAENIFKQFNSLLANESFDVSQIDRSKVLSAV